VSLSKDFLVGAEGMFVTPIKKAECTRIDITTAIWNVLFSVMCL